MYFYSITRPNLTPLSISSPRAIPLTPKPRPSSHNLPNIKFSFNSILVSPPSTCRQDSKQKQDNQQARNKTVHTSARGLRVQDENVRRGFDNREKRGSHDVSTTRQTRLKCKNKIRPSHKPFAAFPTFGQLPLDLPEPVPVPISLNNNTNLPQTLQFINQKLKQLSISESRQPIVQPYRDRSTDSYQYGHGYGYRSNISQSHYQTAEPDHKDRIIHGRPTACEQPHPHLLPQRIIQISQPSQQYQQQPQIMSPHFKPHVSHPHHDTINNHYYQARQYQNWDGPIRQNVEQQKQSKQMYHQKHDKYYSVEQYYQQSQRQASGQEQGQVQSAFQEISQQPNNGNIKQQNQVENSSKITYVLSPYSMNLSSNHPSHSPHNPQYQIPSQITSPLRFTINNDNNRPPLVINLPMHNPYSSKHSQPSASLKQHSEPKIQKLRNNRILHPNKINTVSSDDGQDKWDRILKIRQQTYKKAVSRQCSQANQPKTVNREGYYEMASFGDTAVKDRSGHVNSVSDSPIERVRYCSDSSYIESEVKINYNLEQLRLQDEFLRTAKFPINNNNNNSNNNNSNSNEADQSSTSKLYNKLSQLAQFYHNQQTIQQPSSPAQTHLHELPQSVYTPASPEQHSTAQPATSLPTEMKYSYSFEESKQIQYKAEKELFSRFLLCTDLSWLTIYNAMVQYAQTKYLSHQQSDRQAPVQQQQWNSDILITFIKIGDTGNSIYQNRIISHYIGIWLLTMGYDDEAVRRRVVDNVEMMMLDDVPQQEQEQGTQKQEGGDGNEEDSVRQIAQLMYNNLLYGYLPGDLQLKALLQTCRRGWQYFTFLICRILRTLVLVQRSKHKHTSDSIFTPAHPSQSQITSSLSHVDSMYFYEKLEAVIDGDEGHDGRNRL